MGSIYLQYSSKRRDEAGWLVQFSCLLHTNSTKSWVAHLTLGRTQQESNPDRLNAILISSLNQPRNHDLRPPNTIYPNLYYYALIDLRGYLYFILWLLKCLFSKEESSLGPMSLYPVGTGPLTRRTYTLFTPASKEDRCE